jgi:hypothetical protein
MLFCGVLTGRGEPGKAANPGFAVIIQTTSEIPVADDVNLRLVDIPEHAPAQRKISNNSAQSIAETDNLFRNHFY